MLKHWYDGGTKLVVNVRREVELSAPQLPFPDTSKDTVRFVLMIKSVNTSSTSWFEELSYLLLTAAASARTMDKAGIIIIVL
jgi:hypothetical protein